MYYYFSYFFGRFWVANGWRDLEFSSRLAFYVMISFLFFSFLCFPLLSFSWMYFDQRILLYVIAFLCHGYFSFLFSDVFRITDLTPCNRIPQLPYISAHRAAPDKLQPLHPLNSCPSLSAKQSPNSNLPTAKSPGPNNSISQNICSFPHDKVRLPPNRQKIPSEGPW